MIDDAALRHAMRDYARALLDGFDVGPMLYRLTDQVRDVLDASGAGVSLSSDGQTLQFVAATDADVVAIEEAQVRTSEGPCHAAFRSGERVVVADLTADHRFPRYREVALERGARAVIGIPMPVGRDRIGALNVYWADPHDPAEDEQEVAQLLADMASGYVVNAQELQRRGTLAEQLQFALDSRVIVEQAKGVLVERHGIEPGEAFQRLRTHARSTNTRVHDLAAEVVEGTTDV